MIRVGVNTLFLIPGEVGGTETYLRQTLFAMARQFPDVHLTLFTNRENDRLLRKDLSPFASVDFVPLKFAASNRMGRICREQVQLPMIAGKTHVDVLWSPGYTTPLVCPVPQVVTLHDMQYRTHPEDLSLLAMLVTHLLVNAAALCSRRIIAISEFSRGQIIRYTRARPEKIATVYNGVAASMHTGMKAGKDLEGPRPRGPRYILTVANTYPHKNIHTLVNAFARICHRIDHNLVIVGLARRGEGAVQQALANLPNKARVVRRSKLTHEELGGLYRRADLFVFPSLYEGFGLPILEAMASGCPVVTTRMGSIPEVGGRHVLYAEPPDAPSLAHRMLEIIQWDSEQRRRWIEGARAHAAAFTWEQTAGETLRVLKRAVNRTSV